MRRWLALGLLVGNLVFVGWHLSRPAETPPVGGVPLVEPADAPPLRLVAELSADERAGLERHRPAPVGPAAPMTGADPASSGLPGATAPGARRTCSSVGPFTARSPAEALAARLGREPGLGVRLREEAGQLRSGFWVYIPPFPTRAAADAAAVEMRAKGAGDLFIVTAAEQRHAISLGLFSTPDRADQRAAEVGKLGYRPRVAERFRDAAVFWLDLEEPVGWRFESLDLSGIRAEGYARIETPCPGVSS